MVIATSDSMMRKIVKKLGLNSPAMVIDIAEVASNDDIHSALKERREKKQHVVPVSRTEIQRNFAGKLVSQLKDFFKYKDRQDIRTVVKPLFSFDGQVAIEPEAILEMARRLIVIGDHIHQVRELNLSFPERDTISVTLVVDVKLNGKSALYLARLLQKKLSHGLSFFTGMEVKKVNIRINEVLL